MEKSRIRRYVISVISVWTILLFSVMLWHMHAHSKDVFEIASNTAESSFEKDLVYRRWSASHGGVYVPVTDETPPNPYLSHIPERDITTPSGRKLTLMNPAYMTRQVCELGEKQYGLRGHITSLKPLNPENVPDPWEREKLEGFAEKPVEVSSIEQLDGASYLRLIKPMFTEDGCLKCHASQGYKAGDIRGGISVSVPTEPIQAVINHHLYLTAAGYICIYILGIIAIGVVSNNIKDRVVRSEQVQRKIDNRNTFLKSVLDSLAYPFYVIDADNYNVKLVNSEGENFSSGESLGFRLPGAHANPCEGNCRFIVDEVKKAKKTFSCEYECSGEDGTDRIIKIFGSPILDEDCNIKEVIEYCLDITEKKQVEQRINEEKDKAQLYLDIAEVMMVALDGDGNITLANKKASEVLGYNQDELCGLNWFENFVFAEDQENVRKVFDSLMTQNEPVEYHENHIVTKSGQRRLIAWHNTFLRDKHGRVIGTLSSGEDITELSASENRIKKESAKLSAMISGMKEGVVFADADDIIIEVNPYFLKMMSKSKEEIIGKSIWEFHKGEIQERLRAMLEGFRKDPNSEAVFMHKPFGNLVLDLRVQPIYEDGKYIGVLLNAVDITSLVNAKKRIEESNQRLKSVVLQAKKAATRADEANMYKSQFLANMSHEIRTPLNGIIGFSDILTDTKLSDEQQEYVDIIKSSGHNLTNLIDDILDLSKIEAGKIELEMMEFPLGKALHSIERLMKSFASEKNLDFRVEAEDNLPAVIRTDPNRLNQCLLNLINNAIKFTREGRVYLKVSLDDIGGDKCIRFDVEDTGIGISLEKQEAIFEAFVQADGSTTRQFGGTGLGLAITKKLVELMGGNIRLESEAGKGSTFTFWIPAGVDVAQQRNLDIDITIDETTPEPEAQDSKMSGRVLVVEDTLTNQVLIELILKKAGFDVTLANDGAEAVEKVLNSGFDLILMDIQMPIMNGYEATEYLREQGIKTPIIAVTAYAMKDDEQKCLSVGCDDYVSKPINRKVLLEKIRKHLSANAAILS